jgi:general secretion pathway protein G
MSRRSAFTLIELVVVILILGILAGVAAPKMFNTSAKATDNGLKQSLNIIRDAIELYVSQNGGNYPSCTSPGTDFQGYLTPYLRGQFPKSPVGTKDSVIKPVSGATTTSDNTTGWMYNTTTGTFICNCSSNTASDASIKYDAL